MHMQTLKVIYSYKIIHLLIHLHTHEEKQEEEITETGDMYH